MRVADVMTRDVAWISQDANLQEAAARMKSLDVGTLPVCDGERLVGMITDRDITVRATAEGEGPAAVRVSDIMTPEVVFCFEDALVENAALLMQDKQIRRLVVLDKQERIVGIVSLGDIALEAGNEELAGVTLEGISEPEGR